MTETCFWCGDNPAEKEGPSKAPACMPCFKILYRIWYKERDKHDDFTCNDGMQQGHMFYQHHHCKPPFLHIKGSDHAWCMGCGREIRAKDPLNRLALVKEQISEIMEGAL